MGRQSDSQQFAFEGPIHAIYVIGTGIIGVVVV